MHQESSTVERRVLPVAALVRIGVGLSCALHARRSRGVQCDAPEVQVGALLSPTSVKQRRRAPAWSTPPSVLLEGHEQDLDSSRF
ncbi:hypothetical protein AOLI_G00136790 [Acnodon oligacanthus]